MALRIVHIVEPFASGIIQQISFIVNGTELESTVVHGSRMWVDDEDNVKRLFKKGTIFIHWNHANRPIRPLQDLRAFLFLVRILKNHKNDIVHLHSAKAGFIGRLACKYLGINKVVYTAHGAPFARKDISSVTRGLFVGLEKFGNWLYPTSTISCSESESKLYEVNGMRSHTIRNGVSVEVSNVVKKKSDSKNIVIGFSGIIKAQKDPSFWNEVVKQFEFNEHVKFIWIGEGQQRSLLSSPKISITGWLKPEEGLNQLNQLDVYFSTSLWEGLSLSALEAMALSKPLILRNTVGNTDLIKDGENGFLFNTVDQAVRQLNQLISDKTLRTKYGEKSRILFEKEFDVKFMVSKYHNLYEQL